MSSSAVRAFGGVVASLAPDRIIRDGGLVVVLGVLTLWRGAKFDASTVMSFTVACSLAGLIMARVALRHWRPREVAEAAPEYAAATWRLTALPLVLISVAEILLNRTGVLLLGWSGQTVSAGVFALTFNLAMTVMLPRTAVNALFAPMVSTLSARGDRAALQFVVTRTALWTLVSGLCIALPLMILAEPLLSWFGPDFTRGVTAMRVLSGRAGDRVIDPYYGSRRRPVDRPNPRAHDRPVARPSYTHNRREVLGPALAIAPTSHAIEPP
jgi:O-antigen/teichoic acid export membrane protein